MSDDELLITEQNLEEVFPDSSNQLDLTPFRGIPHATLITGRSCTGKTTLLIDRVVESLENGTDSKDILIVCASTFNEQSLKLALERIIGDRFALPLVSTTRRIALDILSNPVAIEQTGRYPRLLADFEVNILNQNLLTFGLKPRRMKEMLKFFYRKWTELADEVPGWLITAEERAFHAFIIDELTYLRGMLEPELAATAVKWLKLRPKRAGTWRRPQVFVDDYQFLSRASQLLLHLLSTEGLTVTVDEEYTLETFESYPYGRGLEEFLRINPDAERIELQGSYQSDALICARNALAKVDVFDGLPELRPAVADSLRPGSVSAESYMGPAEEFVAIAEKIKALLSSGIEPGTVAITAFNRIWARQVAAALSERGIPTQLCFGSGMSLSGDFRELEKSRALRTYTALRLVTNPADDFSWRCWCGFGDYMANTAVFIFIKEYLATQGSPIAGLNDVICFSSLLQSLETLDPGSIAGLEKVISLHREGRVLIDACKGLTGLEALREISSRLTEGAKSAPPAQLQVPGWDDDSLTTAQLVALYEQHLFFPQLNEDRDVVLIASPYNLHGKHFDNLLVSGFVNGFIPGRDYFDPVATPPAKRPVIRKADLHTISLILGVAVKNLALTWFEKIDLYGADRLSLRIKRIRFEKGERVCLISPSDYLDLIMP